MTFNPAEKRDEHGRWALEQAIKRAISGLSGNEPSQLNDGINYAKGALAKSGDQPAVKAHIQAALRSKRPSVAIPHLRDALSELDGNRAGKPRGNPINHENHGLAKHVSRALVSHVRTQLKAKATPTLKHRHMILRARSVLPDGHSARYPLARAYHAKTQDDVMRHLGDAMGKLRARTKLPEGADTRHRRAAGRYVTRKLQQDKARGLA